MPYWKRDLIGDLHDGVIWLQVPESFPFAFGNKANMRFFKLPAVALVAS